MVLHTGHKFESALGIALTGMTLVVVVSGFVGRYLMSFLGGELREERAMLTTLRREYDALAAQRASSSGGEAGVQRLESLKERVAAWLVPADHAETAQALHLAESIADLEYAIASNEKFKSAFGLWLKFHIVISFVLYGLLGLHVWASIYFGLRWFP